MHRLRRCIFQVKEKHFVNYHTLTKDLLESIIPAVTKLVVAENRDELARTKKLGIKMEFPSPTICGFLIARRLLIHHLTTAEASLESAHILSSVNIDADLLRWLGCELN